MFERGEGAPHAVRKMSYTLSVDGHHFVVQATEFDVLGSGFLSSLLAEDSPFATPEDGIFVLNGVDAAALSSLLHYLRFGTLNLNDGDDEILLSTADFLSIDRTKIEVAMKTRRSLQEERLRGALEVGLAKASHVIERHTLDFYRQVAKYEIQGQHHNKRHDDGRYGPGNGRIFCDTCNSRDIDSTFSEGDPYLKCKGCSRQITYKPNLGWCHKCSLCINCQRDVCPADDPPSRYGCGYHEAPMKKPDPASLTASVQAEVAKHSTTALFQFGGHPEL